MGLPSLEMRIVRRVEHDLENRKVLGRVLHDYSTDRPNAGRAPGGVREASSRDRTGNHIRPGGSDLGRCGDCSLPRNL
jgi:hypothetical protein